jgi:putative NADH-flavin reductase
MKVSLFGAGVTGKTGQHILSYLLKNGHSVKVLTRSAQKPKDNVTFISGDATKEVDVQATINDTEVVIVTLGNVANICSSCQPIINKCIKKTPSVKKLIIITSLGCNESLNGLVIEVNFRCQLGDLVVCQVDRKCNER